MMVRRQILPGTGRGPSRRLVKGRARPLPAFDDPRRIPFPGPSTTPLRAAVSVPVPGGILA